MPGPSWDPDEGRWVLDDGPSPPRRRRRRSVEVIDRPDDDAGSPARSLSPEDLAAGILFPPDRVRPSRWPGAGGRRRSHADDAGPSSDAVTGRHGVDRPGANRAGPGARRGRRRAPERPRPDVDLSDPFPGERRATDTDTDTDTDADTAPLRATRRGGRRRAGGGAPSRGHLRDRNDIGDRRPPRDVDDPPTRRVRPAGAEFDRRGAPARPEDRPGTAVPGLDRWCPDQDFSGAAHATHGPEEKLDEFPYGSDEAPTRVLVDDDVPVHAPATGSDLPDGDGDGEDEDGEGRDVDEPSPVRQRWPWAVGAAAAVAAAVPIAFVVLDGAGAGTGVPEGTVAFAPSNGGGQPGSEPTGGEPTDGDGGGAAPPADPAAPPPATEVTYELTGSGTAGTITFGGGTSVAQVTDAELPWQRTAEAASGPTEYSLTAAGGTGEITCRILVDGAVVSEESAEGDFSAVACGS
ncbi:MmpS family transport accessory protein [Pseudonocardia nematodicida]|uniref:MmpS family transport accessory protein n=1 Tax=Pseudonocardia nematodicida TaxID=1206997 RepID=A0ABV1KHJ1_9PSEU